MMARYSTRPWIRGRSRELMEVDTSLPMPGRENTFSMMMLPPSTSVMVMPKMVSTGMRELRSTWPFKILREGTPLLWAVLT